MKSATWPLAIQPQLLRFIQDHEYERVGDPVTRRADVRLVAATNRNLEEAVKEGRFREDLFYRLNVFELEIPPLRERVEDIEPLANDMLLFFANANRKVLSGFSAEALEAMRAYPWPGNLRELRNGGRTRRDSGALRRCRPGRICPARCRAGPRRTIFPAAGPWPRWRRRISGTSWPRRNRCRRLPPSSA